MELVTQRSIFVRHVGSAWRLILHLSGLAAALVAAASLLCGQQNSDGPPKPVDPVAEGKILLTRGIQLYEAHNYFPAMGAFEQAVTDGNVDAMMYLGMMYAEGHGAGLNYTQAKNWFDRAAAAGNGQAMCNLGILYYQGLGVRQQYTEALRWFRDAAADNNAQAIRLTWACSTATAWESPRILTKPWLGFAGLRTKATRRR